MVDMRMISSLEGWPGQGPKAKEHVTIEQELTPNQRMQDVRAFKR
jgi:hypothetical protein